MQPKFIAQFVKQALRRALAAAHAIPNGRKHIAARLGMLHDHFEHGGNRHGQGRAVSFAISHIKRRIKALPGGDGAPAQQHRRQTDKQARRVKQRHGRQHHIILAQIRRQIYVHELEIGLQMVGHRPLWRTRCAGCVNNGQRIHETDGVLNFGLCFRARGGHRFIALPQRFIDRRAIGQHMSVLNVCLGQCVGYRIGEIGVENQSRNAAIIELISQFFAEQTVIDGHGDEPNFGGGKIQGHGRQRVFAHAGHTVTLF